MAHSRFYPPVDLIPGINITKIDLPGYITPSPDAARARSRCGERFDLNHRPSLLQLPPTQSGTAGVIYMPSGPCKPEDWRIRCIKVGFDAGFRPTVWIGSHKPAETVHAIRKITLPEYRWRSRIERRVWDNRWLDEDMPFLTKRSSGGSVSVLSPREQFEKRGFERHKALDDDGLDLDLAHLGISLWLQLEDVPQARVEPYAGSVMIPSQKKVWTLKIRKTVSSVPTHAELDKRKRRWGALVGASVFYLSVGKYFVS